MTQIVAAALVSHGPLVTGRPEVSKPEQRERVYAGLVGEVLAHEPVEEWIIGCGTVWVHP